MTFFARKKAKMIFENIKYEFASFRHLRQIRLCHHDLFAEINKIRDDVSKIEGFYIKKNQTNWIKKKISIISG